MHKAPGLTFSYLFHIIKYNEIVQHESDGRNRWHRSRSAKRLKVVAELQTRKTIEEGRRHLDQPSEIQRSKIETRAPHLLA